MVEIARHPPGENGAEASKGKFSTTQRLFLNLPLFLAPKMKPSTFPHLKKKGHIIGIFFLSFFWGGVSFGVVSIYFQSDNTTSSFS